MRKPVDLCAMYRKQIKTIEGQILEIEESTIPLLSAVTVKPPLRLNLACGNHDKRGFINVDLFKFKGIDALWDISQPLPFPPKSVAEINLGNSIKHLKMSNLKGVLEGFARCLMDNGAISITFYDFGLISEYYANGLLKIPYINTMLYGAEFKENQIHSLVLDEEWLTGVMRDCGCSVVDRKEDKWVVRLTLRKKAGGPLTKFQKKQLAAVLVGKKQ